MKNILKPFLGLILLCNSIAAQEGTTVNVEKKDANVPHCHSHNHLFSTAPIGVMGDHLHHKNSLMFSYRYMQMNMKGNLEESNDIQNSDVYSTYMVSPESMYMGMHMLSIMYAPSDKFTLMIMGNFLDNSMDLRTKMGMNFSTKSSGLGDTKVTALINLLSFGNSSIHANIGVSIPTGSIEKRDDTPMMSDALLAYPMQLGSGTWNPAGGLTYLGKHKSVLWGAQGSYNLVIGDNAAGYSLGNQIFATAWGTVKASETLNFSIRTKFISNENIEGVNANLNPMMMPLANTNNSGGSACNLLAGINYNVTHGVFNGLKLGGEIGYPVYQNVEGFQMKQQFSAILGAQFILGGQYK